MDVHGIILDYHPSGTDLRFQEYLTPCLRRVRPNSTPDPHIYGICHQCLSIITNTEALLPDRKYRYESGRPTIRPMSDEFYTDFDRLCGERAIARLDRK